MQFIDKQKAFGLDISDLSIKIVQFQKKGKLLDLVSVGSKKMPDKLVVNGEIQDEDELAKVVKQAVAEVKGAKIAKNRVICNLPEEEVFIRVIQLPKMKEQEIEKAIYWEIENHIPLKIDEVYLDWHVIGDAKEKEDKMNVIFAAAPQGLVTSYLGFLKKAGLKPVALEPESMALVRSLIKEEKNPKPVLIVDLGETGSNFVVFSGEAASFTSRFKVSGNAITEAISKELKVGKEEAIKFKIKYGLVKEESVYQALEPVVAALAKDIKDSINYYIDHIADVRHLDRNISQIILCGGDSLLIGLPEFLSQKLVLPVKFGNPWINISPFVPKNAQKLGLSYKTSLSYAVAFGLALRGHL